VFLPPIILSWPLTDNGFPFPFKTEIILSNMSATSTSEDGGFIKDSDSSKNTFISGSGNLIGANTLISSLLKIKIFPTPVQVCLENKNKIYEGDKEVDYKEFFEPEEAGAISVKINRIDGSLEKDFYLKREKGQSCYTLPIEGALFEKKIEIRNPVSKDCVVDKQGQNKYQVLMYKNIGFYRVKWDAVIFLVDCLILIIAWWLILSSFFAIWKFIYSGKDVQKLEKT